MLIGGEEFTDNTKIYYTACDQSEYQQDVVIHRTEGENYQETSSGLNIWHIYIGNKCKEDYGDVRFLDKNNIELSYYLWPEFDSSSAKFCVKLTNANLSGILNIWYGNDGAVSNSDIDIFLFAQDFSTNTDLSEWTIESGDWSITNGVLSCSSFHVHTFIRTPFWSNSQYIVTQVGNIFLCVLAQNYNNYVEIQSGVQKIYTRISGNYNLIGSCELRAKQFIVINDTPSIISDGVSITSTSAFSSGYVGFDDYEGSLEAVYIQTYSETPPSMIEPLTGCVAYWDFRDGSLLDVIDNKVLTQYNSPTLVNDHLDYKNGAYHFNGTNQYMNATTFQPTINDARTFFLVVKIDRSNIGVTIYSIGQTGNDNRYAWLSLSYSEDELALSFANYGGGIFAGISCSYIDDQYHVIACTIPNERIIGNTDGFNIYIDGVKQVSIDEPHSTASVSTIKGTLVLGKYSGINIQYAKCDISAVLMFNRAMTDDEIAELSKILSYKYIYPIQRMERK